MTSNLLSKLSRVFNWYVGIMAIGVGTYWFIEYWKQTGSIIVNFNGPLTIGIPLYFAGHTLVITTVSTILLGASLIVLDHKYHWRALPLLLMVAGAFDIICARALVFRLAGIDTQSPVFWTAFQLALMFGGWLLAGCPKFNFNTPYVIPAVVVFFLFIGGNMPVQFTHRLNYLYELFEATLVLFVYEATTPR